MQRAWYGLRLRMALTYVGVTVLERDQKLTSRIEPIQERCDRTEIKEGFA
jgi:hypothetical protein